MRLPTAAADCRRRLPSAFAAAVCLLIHRAARIDRHESDLDATVAGSARERGVASQWIRCAHPVCLKTRSVYTGSLKALRQLACTILRELLQGDLIAFGVGVCFDNELVVGITRQQWAEILRGASA